MYFKGDNLFISITVQIGFPLRISSVNVTNQHKTAEVVTFTEEIISRNFIFCAVLFYCHTIALLNKFVHYHSFFVNDESRQS